MRDMRVFLCTAFVVVTGALLYSCSLPSAAEGDSGPGSSALDVLDANEKNVTGYRVGQGSGPLVTIEQAIRSAPPEQREEIEARLLAWLESPDATDEAKRFIFRMLRHVGTSRAVSVVAPLLADGRLSHMAWYALHPIADPTVDQALRAALAKAPGDVKVGLVNALGERRRTENAETLAALLEDGDPAVREAALVALGKVGGEKAVAALERARASADPTLREAAERAYLDCADRLLTQGERDMASLMFAELVHGGHSGATRIAAFRGQVDASADGGAGLVADMLRTGTPEFRSIACRLVREVRGQDATAQFQAVLPNVPADTKVLLLWALAERGDRAALPAVVEAVKDSDETVREAAYEALRRLGDASVVPFLLEVAAVDRDQEGDSARDCLARLPEERVDVALVDAMDSAGTALKVEAIHALVARRATSVTSVLVALTDDADPVVRAQSLEALGAMGDTSALPRLLELMDGPSAPMHEGAARALAAVARRVGPEPEVGSALRTAWDNAASDAAKSLIVYALDDVGGDAALEIACRATTDGSAETQDAAVRALAAWRSPGALPVLLEIAERGRRQSHRILALRGYIRLLGTLPDRPVPEKLEGFRQAMALAQRVEERRRVLGGLGHIAAPEALRMVESHWGDPELSEEVVAATIGIALAIAPTHPAEAEAALERLAQACDDDDLRARLHSALAELRTAP